MTAHSLLRCSLGLFLSAGLFAQGRGPTTPTPTNPTPTNPTNPSRGTTSPFPGNDTTPTDIMPRPMFLSGKVVMEDGTPPPDPVVIQIVCRGIPRSVAYTDSKGNFSVDLANRNNAVFADASEPTNDLAFSPTVTNQQNSPGLCPGEMNNLGSELLASLAGYRSDTVNLGVRRALDNPDIGRIVLHRLANVEGLTISATSALAPKNAKKALSKARDQKKKGKWEDAEKELQKAVEIYPQYAAAWLELGNIQLQQKNVAAARDSFAKALAADPKYVGPYLQLASIAAGEQKWDDVVAQTDRLLHLDPVDFPQAWLFNSVANYQLHKIDEAEKSVREGLSHDPNHRFPTMSHLLGVILAMRQDYAGSAKNLRDYLRYAPHASDLEQVKKQLAEVEKVAAATPEVKKP
jgi:tetratricopeptide (TPR) repeat protein